MHIYTDYDSDCSNTCMFFFFQAEDGIRDKLVTGVQTCALPILPPAARGPRPGAGAPDRGAVARAAPGPRPLPRREGHLSEGTLGARRKLRPGHRPRDESPARGPQIGRAHV